MRTTDPIASASRIVGRRPQGRRPISFVAAALSVLLTVGTACSGPADQRLEGTGEPAAGSVPPEARPGTIVDSIFPIEEEMRRFRATLAEAPEHLEGGAVTRDELVARFVAAVEAADTAALRELLMTRAEFAYLYYPHTMYTRPPYELSPALLWFQIETGTSRGFSRLMEAFGGRPVEWTGYRCAPEPRIEGANRVWAGCRIEIAPAEGEPAEAVLFGSILEREGVFKFVSYSNDL